MLAAKYEIESDLQSSELKERLREMFQLRQGFPPLTEYLFNKLRIGDQKFKFEVTRQKDSYLSMMVRCRLESMGNGTLMKLRVAYPNYILYTLWAVCLLVCFIYAMVFISSGFDVPIGDWRDLGIVGTALLFSFYIPWNTRRQTRKLGEIFLYTLAVNGIARQY